MAPTVLTNGPPPRETPRVAYVQLDGGPIHLVSGGRMYFANIHGFREASAVERAQHAWSALCGAMPRFRRWTVLAGRPVEREVCGRCLERAARVGAD